MSIAVLLVALAVPEPLELRFVDLQRAVLELPEGRAAKARLEAARSNSQTLVDRRRARLLAERARLSEAELAERSRALDAEIDAAEQALEALQASLLKPILERLDELRVELEAPGRTVSRLDEVPLVGWPKVCDLTEALLARARGEDGLELGPEPRCRVRRFRRVELAPLAAASAEAKARATKLEAFRKRQQARVDEARARLEREAAEGAAPEQLARERAALDRRVASLRDALAKRKRSAEDAVFRVVTKKLARAARGLEGVAVVEATAAPLPRPAESGQAWARSVLGLRGPPESSVPRRRR